MRDPARIPKVLNRLHEAWALCPDLRLAQLISAIEGTGKDPFYIEDEEWLKLIEKFIEQRKNGQDDDRSKCVMWGGVCDLSDACPEDCPRIVVYRTIQKTFGKPKK